MSPEELAARRTSLVAEPCLRLYGPDVRRARDAYVDRMGERAAPLHDDWSNPSALNYVHSGSVGFCRDAIDRAIALAPPEPGFDTAAAAYITALEVLARLADETETYYERRTYRDDLGARGRELHTELPAAFTNFFAADRALRIEASAIERRVLDVELTRLAADPTQRRGFLIERTRGCAMAVVEAITLTDIVPAGRGARIEASDASAVWGRVEACQQFVDEMLAAPEASQIDGSFLRDSRELVAAMLIAGRAIGDQQTLRSEDAAAQLIHRVVTEYNDLVDDYNRMLR